MTPTIGDNGNWYIDGEDTGKPSVGKDGKSAYQSLHSNYPVTTVLNDAGAHMEFSYNADPKNYIAAEHAKMEAAFDAKLAEIIALLPAETQAAMIDNETTNLLNESEE